MKIAVWHNLPSGGGMRALFGHISGLLDLGHQVEVWCPPTSDANYLALDDLCPVRRPPLNWPITAKFTDYWQITLPIRRSLLAMEEHCAICASEINAGGFDILFANSCQFFATTPIGRLVKIPSVLYLQEPYRPLYEAMPRSKWAAIEPRLTGQSATSYLRAILADWRRVRNDRTQVRAEINNAAAFTRVLVNSLFSRESVLRAYGVDSDVCYLGVDTERFVDRGRPREDFVVGLGSYNRAKNIQFVIEAIGAMTCPRPGLVWIGNSAGQVHIAEMRTLAGALGVDFTPLLNVADDVLVDTLNRAVAMIYAPRLEPFGLAPLEAGSCGVPVVAVAEGGVRETIVPGISGLLVRNDVTEAAEAIASLRNDPVFARKLGASAQALVAENWSLKSAVANIEASLLRYIPVNKLH